MTQHLFFQRGAFVAMAITLYIGLSSAPGLTTTKKAKKASPAKKQGSTKFLPGSQETRKERTERLRRECKGRVNAGACEGYTH